jgi:hypothetical protein
VNTLLVSVPAVELARLAIPASVFDADHLRTAHLSLGLRRALNVVFQSVAPNYSKIVCVTRPELFTHGAARAWLDDRIPGASEHLALSNGHALKSLSGLRNTVFVYGLDQRSAQVKYRTLLWRAPEMLGTFARQINGAHPFGTCSLSKLPESVAMDLKVAAPVEDLTWYYPLYWNRHSEKDSAERMLAWGRTDQPTFAGCERLTLIPCSDAGLQDARFCHSLAQTVANAGKDPTLGVLIGLPSFEDLTVSTSQRLIHLLAGLARGGVAVPRVRLPRVAICTEIHEAEWSLKNMPFDLLLHDSFPLWGYTRPFYDKALTVRISRSKGAEVDGAQAVEYALLGRQPQTERWSPDFLARMGLD